MRPENISRCQSQTSETFGFKWQKGDTYSSESFQNHWKSWLLEKYFDGSPALLEKFMEGEGKKILDAGCGAGMSSLLLFGDHLKRHCFVGVDISDSIEVAKKRFAEKGIPARFIKSDLNSIPEGLGCFDIIFSEGVLHHTDSVEKAILNLAKRLKPEGKLLFYVYRKKAPIREFSDDYIRNAISSMTNEEAWEALMPLTRLGKVLGELNLEIEIPEDIPLLEIQKGRHNLQRLFYYKFCKAFYREDYSLEEMNHINFDWFRPHNCFRHTPEEIQRFCLNAKLKVLRIALEESGISVLALNL